MAAGIGNQRIHRLEENRTAPAGTTDELSVPAGNGNVGGSLCSCGHRRENSGEEHSKDSERKALVQDYTSWFIEVNTDWYWEWDAGRRSVSHLAMPKRQKKSQKKRGAEAPLLTNYKAV
jgi:hypothetical protein